MKARLRSDRGAYRVEFEGEFGSGTVWLHELDAIGVLVVRVDGRGSFEVQDDTRP